MALAGGLGLLALAGGAWAYVESIRPQLDLGVGYAARVACGCRFVGHRSLGDCKKDFEPGMERITLDGNEDRLEVTASVPLIASRTVRYSAALGCQAEPFRGTALTVEH